MIGALLIDLDGVIRLWDPAFDRRIEETMGLPPGALLQTAFAPDLLSAVITGRVTDEDWRQQVVKRLRRAFPAADGEKIVQLWSAPAGEINGAVLEVVRLCRQQVKVVLVTNATSRLPSDLQRLGLLTEFDFIINSSVVGYGKPQPEIFYAALEAAGITAAEAFFVDDSASHVAAANGLGIAGHVYRELDALTAELRRYGLL